MRTLSLIIKSLKEQLRSYWILLLSLSMGPFFIFVYFLIMETSKPQYSVLVANHDKGCVVNGEPMNHGQELMAFLCGSVADSLAVPYTIQTATDKNVAIETIKNKKADALIVIAPTFSDNLEKRKAKDTTAMPSVEFIGDLTNTNYLISAVWANELVNEYALRATNSQRMIEVKETALGTSGSIDEYDMMVPGLLIVSLIMLMFTASIAFVSEVENKTIMRLKLSKLTALEFLGGIGFVQLLVGLASILFTLVTAIALGFNYTGSILLMILIAGLTSLSIIAFSLIIAAVTKSANEVLVVGNFPMFLFMFFTGAAFPLKSEALFTLAGYPINVQGLMTPTHAISALNKTFVMNMDFTSILPEIIAIVTLTGIYFMIGWLIFKQRHLKLV